MKLEQLQDNTTKMTKLLDKEVTETLTAQVWVSKILSNHGITFLLYLVRLQSSVTLYGNFARVWWACNMYWYHDIVHLQLTIF